MSCYFYFVLLPLGPSCGECNVVSLYFMCCSVNGSVDLCVACLKVFVNCLVKQFVISLGVVVILLMNVIEVFSVCVEVLCCIVYGLPENVRVVPVIPVCI